MRDTKLMHRDLSLGTNHVLALVLGLNYKRRNESARRVPPSPAEFRDNLPDLAA
jgi:hypothetical protein